MSRVEMARTCMTIRNLKLYAWNEYFRSYTLFGANDIDVMNDRVSMYTLKMFTNAWIAYKNELDFCKIFRHVCECMCNKICNRTIRIRKRVKHGTCNMKYVNIVCNAWYGLELKNHIDKKYFYSKAKIQPSPQIKLWGGKGLRKDRSKTNAKLWKKPYSLLILWYIGVMAAASTTNVDMEMGMVDENEIYSSSQKCPTMAQITISQKKAKGKVVNEPKRPPFWLGFQPMNWTNRAKELPMDNMELISELIRKGMEIDEATECQQAIPSFPFVIQEEWPSKKMDGIELEWGSKNTFKKPKKGRNCSPLRC